MIREIVNLALLNAFTMDPADTAYPLTKRIPGKRLALLNWGPGLIKVGFATRSAEGFAVAPEQLTMPADTKIAQLADTLKARTDCDCVAILYNAVNLFCEVQTNVKPEGSETLEHKLRGVSAKEIVGASYEEDKIYQILYAPDRTSRVLFSTPRAPYVELEKALKDEGLKVVRSQLGAYAMLNGMLSDESWAKAETETAIVLPTVVNQVHVVTAGFDGVKFWPEVFRASPLFLPQTEKQNAPEMFEQVRAFFLNCAENAVLSKKIIGKKVVFRVLSSGTSPEAALDLETYLQDRLEVGFENYQAEPNFDFRALIAE